MAFIKPAVVVWLKRLLVKSNLFIWKGSGVCLHPVFQMIHPSGKHHLSPAMGSSAVQIRSRHKASHVINMKSKVHLTGIKVTPQIRRQTERHQMKIQL